MDVKMDGSVLEEKSSFKMLRLTFSSKLDWGSYIISLAKTTSKEIGPLIHPMNFLSPEAALYLYKSTIHLCMEYFCHVWAGARSCYLELLGKLQKWMLYVMLTFLGPFTYKILSSMFILGKHKSNLGDDLNFSCKQWKSYFPRCSKREVTGIAFRAILKCYL